MIQSTFFESDILRVSHLFTENSLLEGESMKDFLISKVKKMKKSKKFDEKMVFILCYFCAS